MRKNSKKLIALLGTAILAMGAVAGCSSSSSGTTTAAATEAATEAASEAADSSAAEEETEAASEEAAAEDLSGSISMVGSTSMENFVNALSEAFMAKYPGVTVTPQFVGSGAGIEAVTNGTAET